MMADILLLQYLHFHHPWWSAPIASAGATLLMIKQKTKNVPDIFWHSLPPWKFQQRALISLITPNALSLL
jgi:D-hexose-6-phosphate mutarotase